MGLTLQFLIGDKRQIIGFVKDEDFDGLERIEDLGIADFSFHLIPNDLNLLVNAASEVAGLQKFGLREHLDFQEFYFDAEDRGACFVNPRIKELFSMFNPDQAVDISKTWVKKMEKEHNEEIGVNDDIVESVRQLILLSKNSVAKNIDLVHLWFG
ncbi:MAG: hypothetical protein V4608_16055 [Bacteroidota bacterium]